MLGYDKGVRYVLTEGGLDIIFSMYGLTLAIAYILDFNDKLFNS